MQEGSRWVGERGVLGRPRLCSTPLCCYCWYSCHHTSNHVRVGCSFPIIPAGFPVVACTALDACSRAHERAPRGCSGTRLAFAVVRRTAAATGTTAGGAAALCASITAAAPCRQPHSPVPAAQLPSYHCPPLHAEPQDQGCPACICVAQGLMTPAPRLSAAGRRSRATWSARPRRARRPPLACRRRRSGKALPPRAPPARRVSGACGRRLGRGSCPLADLIQSVHAQVQADQRKLPCPGRKSTCTSLAARPRVQAASAPRVRMLRLGLRPAGCCTPAQHACSGSYPTPGWPAAVRP